MIGVIATSFPRRLNAPRGEARFHVVAFTTRLRAFTKRSGSGNTTIRFRSTDQPRWENCWVGNTTFVCDHSAWC